MRTWLKQIIEADRTRNLIIVLIVINAVVIGLETSPTAMANAGPLLTAIDLFALAVFTVEILAKLFIYRLAFFKDPWNVFDFLIVSAAYLPAGAGFSVLRALRILRALRLVSAVPKMRQVVQALLSAVPAMGSVIGLLSLIFYIAAVMTTKLFGEGGRSLYSLFQIMTLESWSMGIVRPVMEVYPLAWVFFVPFILISSFAVLNLFIAIIVNAMQEVAHEEEDEERVRQKAEKEDALTALKNEIASLRADIGDLKAASKDSAK